MTHKALSLHGFSKGQKGWHWRAAPGAFVAVELQTSQFGHQYYVNLAWTMQGLRAMNSGEPFDPAGATGLAFVLHGRLEGISRSASPVPWSWDIDGDEEVVRANLQAALAEAVSTIESVEQHFTRPERFLDELPPDLLERERRDRLVARKSRPRRNSIEYDHIRSVLHGFYPRSFHLAYWLMHVSRRSGRERLTEGYLKLATESMFYEWDKTLIDGFLAADKR